MSSILAPAILELELESAPESVSLVRAGLTGFAAALRLDPELLDDLQMVASEACNNVVVHAYDRDGGPMAVRATAIAEGIELVVCDAGTGFDPDAVEPGTSGGLGLPVIRSLADEAEFAPAPGGGTAVRARFAREIPGLAETTTEGFGPKGTSAPLPGDVIATVAPVDLMSTVLERLARALAAQARFSVDRLREIHAVVDSLVGHAESLAIAQRVSFALGAETRRLMLRVGPLRRAAAGVVEQLTPALPRLVDELRVEPLADAEVLCLALSEHRLARAS